MQLPDLPTTCSLVLQAAANISVTVTNVVVKYQAPASVATLTATRLALFSAGPDESALPEVGLTICACKTG